MNSPENPHGQQSNSDAGEPAEYQYLPDPPKPGFWQKLISRKFLFISIVAHVIFGVVAAYYIVQRNYEKQKVVFKPSEATNSPQKRDLEKKITTAKQKKSGGAPPQAKRIAVTGLANLAIPDIEISSTSSVIPGMANGIGGAGMGPGSGIGTGPGGRMNGGDGAPINFFLFGGPKGGMVGSFYDLKQTRDRKGNVPNRGSYTDILKKWVEGGMKDSFFNEYFKAPQQLSATQFLIPKIEADEAPKAYGVEKDVRPSQWIAVYRGKVRPPTAGDWCFVGQADDVILVAVNGKLVLDGSWERVANPPENGKVGVNYANSGHPTGGYVRSEPIHFNAGEYVDLMVAIGERPGGKFWAVLGAEQASGKGGNGGKNVPLFKVANVKVPRLEPVFPEIDVDARPWSIQGGGTTGSLLDSLIRR
jgi:hypothetical protein